jgi:hypothetical protein
LNLQSRATIRTTATYNPAVARTTTTTLTAGSYGARYVRARPTSLAADPVTVTVDTATYTFRLTCASVAPLPRSGGADLCSGSG